MDKQKEVLVLTQKEPQAKPSFKEAVKYGMATAVVLGSAQIANAAEITTIAEGASGEIEAGKAVIIGLFTAGAILLGIFAGWRYFKKGVNSA